ncbi:efflux transporter outer membrane subunit [Buttiauxella selenatireducens]|uniref:Efflux transporter outer membrane subunit n=1 Tax=Buttiauxella selenatireducens TaxID=3073902 RepID=A0ABY9S920_9ENTR|nr:efflux transporter outer membrane subunit [Buttiauxella sp. R73]WMY72951.1 efflux transporter outer membrane subunit [Buttiauxella sp. R73]
MKQIIKLPLFFIILLTGCGAWVKSDYQKPVISIPSQWRAEVTGSAYLKNNLHWWNNFNDPQLSMLIEQALTSNNDLAKAGLQLQKARLQAGLTNTNQAPDVTLSSSANNNKNLNENTASNKSFNTSLALSYEPDLWGKLARIREQAEWETKASEQDRQEIALTLIGNTAQYYWQIANLNQQIKLQEQGIAIAQDTVKITTSRYNAGDVTQLDVLVAEQSVIERQNQLNILQQQREETRNALALLFNRPPGDRRPEREMLDTRQDVPVAQRTPLEVISRRPDVSSSESQLRAALAGSDAARLSFYPSLTLDASLGAANAVFQQWFANPASAVGGTLALPFVQWNKVQLTIDQSRVDVQIAALNFRAKVYSALSDVDNAMSSRLSYQQRKNEQQKISLLAEKRVSLAKSQYLAGEVSFQTWLDAQDSLLNSETTLSELQYNYLYSTMKLWLALGG